MVILVASLENGTYEDEYLNNKSTGIDSGNYSIEEFTKLMIEGEATPKTKEEVRSKNYFMEEPADVNRWESIKKLYNK